MMSRGETMVETGMYQGSLTALITPMDTDGRIDFEVATKLIERQIEAGTSGLVPAGTTGESPTLSHEEHGRIIAHCVETSNGRVPVMAGAGSNRCFLNLVNNSGTYSGGCCKSASIQIKYSPLAS